LRPEKRSAEYSKPNDRGKTYFKLSGNDLANHSRRELGASSAHFVKRSARGVGHAIGRQKKKGAQLSSDALLNQLPERALLITARGVDL
jgi:hypothetical protein